MNIVIMCHDFQFELLGRVLNFTRNIRRINYGDNDFIKFSKNADLIFLFVGDAHHDHFMNIARERGCEGKCISLVNAFSFYKTLSRHFDRKVSGFGFIRFLAFNDLLPREYYAYGIVLSTAVALEMGVKQLSAIEFGVFTGRGLLALSSICELITDEVGIKFKVFGFDTGAGLPSVSDWRDHPEIWYTGDMVMPDIKKVREMLPQNCELIIGDIKDTMKERASEIFNESPLGFVSIDVDTYSSTKSCLDIFTDISCNYLPVVPVWVDDSYVNIFQTNFAGEALAINEFNATNLRKIDKKIVRTGRQSKLWHHCYYFAHIFDHHLRNEKNSCNFYINHNDY